MKKGLIWLLAGLIAVTFTVYMYMDLQKGKNHEPQIDVTDIPNDDPWPPPDIT